MRLTTLDRAVRAHGIGAPDFIKIDAEGVEDRIIAGGGQVLADTSPVVMFELAGEAARSMGRAGAALRQLGYGLYRVLEAGPMLVPYRPGDALDGYELNLFAVKPDRAFELAALGLLVEEARPWAGGDADAGEVMEQAFIRQFGFPGAPPPKYAAAFAAYAAWRNGALPAPVRLGAIQFAYRALGELCAGGLSLPRLSTFARVALAAGERMMAVTATRHIFELSQRGGVVIEEPFWPAAERYDTLPPSGDPGIWFVAAALERNEMSRAYSSMFTDVNTQLGWLTATAFASDEMHRRHYLAGLRQGRRGPVPEQVSRNSPLYRNGEAWALLGQK